MKTVILCLIAIFFYGCAERAPVVRGAVAVAPAAPQTSLATEDLIAQKADAAAKGDKPLAKALDKAEGDQQKAELVGSVRPLALLGMLALALAAFLATEGASKMAMGVGASGLVLIFGPIVYGPLVAHSGAIAWAFILAVVAVLCFHIKVSGKKLRTASAALEHVASGGSVFQHPLQHVRDLIAKVWATARDDAHALAQRLRHFGHLTESKSVAVASMSAPTITQPPTA